MFINIIIMLINKYFLPIIYCEVFINKSILFYIYVFKSLTTGSNFPHIYLNNSKFNYTMYGSQQF